jgi:hypothetical protein
VLPSTIAGSESDGKRGIRMTLERTIVRPGEVIELRPSEVIEDTGKALLPAPPAE